MYKKEFIRSNFVKEFIIWVEKRMDTPNSFSHGFEMKKARIFWEADSIYNAFENYQWPFRFIDPITKELTTGNTFEDCHKALTKLSKGLKSSILDGDDESCISYCISILEWGGVRNKNDLRIYDIGNEVCKYFQRVKERFSEDISSNDYYYNGLIMNSGFTKLYSFYMEDFIIYDGRLGAALGHLVKLYCQDKKIESVPEELLFAWGRGQESKYVSSQLNKRNPSVGSLSFPELLNNPRRHTESSIRANWLISMILKNTDSKFNKLDKQVQMRALEAALFMIGYKVKGVADNLE